LRDRSSRFGARAVGEQQRAWRLQIRYKDYVIVDTRCRPERNWRFSETPGY
jgi:hypothetical protein